MILQTNCKLIYSNYEQVRRQRTSLSDSSLWIKDWCWLTIDDQVSCQNAVMDHGNKMVLEALPSDSTVNKIPFYSIKSFCKIKFKKESFLFPTFEVKIVYYFLGYNDVRSNMSTLDKSSLRGMYNMRKVNFNPFSL